MEKTIDFLKLKKAIIISQNTFTLSKLIFVMVLIVKINDFEIIFLILSLMSIISLGISILQENKAEKHFENY